jgi:ATP-binding protein involved in chromosome partitioning
MEDDILAALGKVSGPDGRTPLPQTALIGGLTVRDGRAYLALEARGADRVIMDKISAAARTAIEAMPGITRAVVTLTADGPGRPAAQGGAPAGQGHGQGQAPGPARTPQAVTGVRHIIAVASGKGGVGKSTTAVNLALALHQNGWTVGLLDADIYGPSVPRLLALTDKPTANGRIMQPLEALGLKVMSIGLLVEERTAMIWRGPMVMSALTQMLREVDWGTLDCLVVDMPPGTGDAQLTMAQSVPLAGAVIVSTPQDLALIDARRGVAMFERVQVPILGIVENMSYFLCPQCGARTDIFAHGGARHEAESSGVPFLGEVPLDMAIREASDAGRPIVASAPEGAHAMAYRTIATSIRERLEGVARRAPPRIVIE